MNSISQQQFVFLTALSALLFVLPIPGTIALRYLLLVTLLGMVSYFWHKKLLADPLSVGIKILAWGLFLILLWLVAHTLFIAVKPEIAWKEIWSQWVPALCAALIGVFSGRYFQHQRLASEKVMAVVLTALLVQSLFSLIVSTPEYLATGIFPQGQTNWTAGKLEISYWNNLGLAFIAVDLLVRQLFGQKVSSLKTSILWSAAVLLVFSNLLFGARNGVIGSALLLFSMVGLLVFQSKEISRKRLVPVVLVVLVTLGAVIGFGYKTDVRWQNFTETAQLGWEIDETDAWYRPDTPFPTLSTGQEVDSGYVRIAWIRAGIRWISENPYGWGYSRNAFRHVMKEKYPESRLGHSHSGWVDLGIGLGLPGVLLWLSLSVGLISVGAFSYLRNKNALGLVLFFIVAGFNGRMMLDSVNKDHMLVVFMFLVGLLAAYIDKRKAGE